MPKFLSKLSQKLHGSKHKTSNNAVKPTEESTSSTTPMTTPEAPRRSTLLNLVKFITPLVGAAPIPGAQVIGNVTLDIIARVQTIPENAEAFINLSERIKFLLFLVVKSPKTQGLTSPIERFQHKLEEFKTKNLETDGDVRAFFNSLDYKQRIAALQSDLQQAISDVQFAIGLETYKLLEAELPKWESEQSGNVHQDIRDNPITAKEGIQARNRAEGSLEQNIVRSPFTSDRNIDFENIAGQGIRQTLTDGKLETPGSISLSNVSGSYEWQTRTSRPSP